MIYLVLLHDDLDEILSAWSTRELAQAEIERLLAKEEGSHWYWMSNRLDIKRMYVDEEQI